MGVSSHSGHTKVNITLKGYCDMVRFTSLEQIKYQIREEKKQDVMRIVEALIAGGGYDLDPDETVNVAFRIVDKINKQLLEESNR